MRDTTAVASSPMTDEDLEYFAEPDGLDDLDVFGSSGGSEADARQAGDDGVQGLDKITAQMSGGEHRPEQQEMCRAVAEAMATGTHLVVQAGTGTGKSLAYLVPAALSGKKVVVATATKALQDQLAEKDLPQVEAGLGLPAPLDFAVLKGRSNYVCRQRVAEVGSGGIQAELGDQGAGRADEPTVAEESEERAGSGRAARRHRRGSAPAGGVVAEVAERRPGRPQLRALGPGLEHGQRRPTGVPRRLQLPVGRALLRRGGARTGVGRRRRRGQHAPLRGAPRQRRSGAARTRRGHLRRGPRARGGHDVEPRGGGDPRPVPFARDLCPCAGRGTRRRPARLPGLGRRPARRAAR